MVEKQGTRILANDHRHSYHHYCCHYDLHRARRAHRRYHQVISREEEYCDTFVRVRLGKKRLQLIMQFL